MDYERLFKRWVLSPYDFISEAIIETYNKAAGKEIKITTQQIAGIEAIRELVVARLKRLNKQAMTEREVELNKKLGVSIMAGKGIGKDALAAWIIIWFMSCFPYCKVLCTSVSADQLNKVLWSEIGKWLQNSIARNWLTLQNDKLFCHTIPKDIIGKRWFAFPKTANPKSSITEQVETLSGVHEEYMLVVVDEGSGIPDPVFSPLESTLTQPCNFVFMIFNPTRSKGYAVDSQYKNNEYWLAQRWNVEDSELGDKEVIERTKERYGIDSNPYRISILGLPPLVDEHTLIPMDWIMDAVEREIQPLGGDPVIKGLDCGAGGDKSVIVTRKGGKVFSIKRMTTQDSQALINWAATDFMSDNGDVLRVDNIGIGWAVYGGLFDRLGGKVESADSRRTANNPDKFYNKRAEMYWTLREKFEKGLISIPDDPDLINELSVTKVTYEKGKTKIIEKSVIRKELGHSPDSADSLALSYYYDDDILYRTQQGKSGRYCHQEGAYKHYQTEGWLGT